MWSSSYVCGLVLVSGSHRPTHVLFVFFFLNQIGKALAHVSLLPLFLFFALGVLVVVRRDLQTVRSLVSLFFFLSCLFLFLFLFSLFYSLSLSPSHTLSLSLTPFDSLLSFVFLFPSLSLSALPASREGGENQPFVCHAYACPRRVTSQASSGLAWR